MNLRDDCCNITGNKRGPAWELRGCSSAGKATRVSGWGAQGDQGLLRFLTCVNRHLLPPRDSDYFLSVATPRLAGRGAWIACEQLLLSPYAVVTSLPEDAGQQRPWLASPSNRRAHVLLSGVLEAIFFTQRFCRESEMCHDRARRQPFPTRQVTQLGGGERLLPARSPVSRWGGSRCTIEGVEGRMVSWGRGEERVRDSCRFVTGRRHRRERERDRWTEFWVRSPKPAASSPGKFPFRFRIRCSALLGTLWCRKASRVLSPRCLSPKALSPRRRPGYNKTPLTPFTRLNLSTSTMQIQFTGTDAADPPRRA